MEPAAPVGPPSAQSAGSGTITGPPDARRRQDRRSPQRDRAAVKKTKVLTEIFGRAPKGPHYLLEKERNEMFYLMSLNMGSVKLLCGTGVRTQGPSL